MTIEAAKAVLAPRNVLVTGGSGLIGTAVRRHLSKQGHSVNAIDITDFGRPDPELTIMGFEDTDRLDDLVKAREIDSIVHCGAISGPMLAHNNPMLIVQANIVGTSQLLDLARRHNLHRVVFSSSISVYGNADTEVIDESTTTRPTSVYGSSKVSCETLLEGFSAEYGVDCASLRIARVYGPYRRANCYLANIIRDAKLGRVTEIPCDPDFAYHYIYVNDVAEALVEVLLASRDFGGRVYNVSGSAALTMPEIAAIAQRTVDGAQIRLVPGADEVPDVQREFDISRIAREVGWTPRFSLERGLEAYGQAMARDPASRPA